MKNAMQLKGLIKNIAKEKKIAPQIILQNYMLERLLERISLSKYKDHYILKGGFLIAAMVGLDTRATMDMDATIKGYPVEKASIQSMIEEIINISIADSISFTLKSIEDIRETDDYAGYRVALIANYEKMAVPLKLDITTGDKITPKEITFSYKSMFGNKNIPVLAYNLSTILAEKLETVIARGDQNTRPRDYYDIFILYKLYSDTINWENLKQAFTATVLKRGSQEQIVNYKSTLNTVVQSLVMQKQWDSYSNSFDYAKGITFKETCDTVLHLLNHIV